LKKLLNILRILGRIISIGIAGFFVISLLLVFLISLPPIQSSLVRWSTSFLEKELETRIEVGEVDLGLPVHGVLERVVIYDQQDVPMIQLRALRLDLLTFSAWKYLRNRDEVQEIKLSYLELIEPQLFLYKSPGDTSMNISFLSGGKKKEKQPPRRKLRFELPEIHLVNGRLRLIDSTDQVMDSVYVGRMNFKNLQVEGIRGQLGVMFQPGGPLELDVENLAARETRSGFALQHLSGELLSDTVHVQLPDCYQEQPFLQLNDLQLQAGRTDLRADIRLINEDFSMLFDTLAQEQFRIALASSDIDFATISAFLPKPLPLYGVLTAQGFISGSLDYLYSPDFRARFGKDTRIRGEVGIANLTEPEDLLFDINLEESKVVLKEIQQMIPAVELPIALQRLAAFELNGTYQGHYADFIANANIVTKVGKANANLHMVLPSRTASGKLKYEGYLTTTNLNLNALGAFEGDISNKLNFRGRIEGEGIRLGEFNSSFDATIRKSNLRGFEIDSLYGKVTMSDQQIFGGIQLNDAHGDADLIVDVNVGRSPGVFRVDGTVNELDLQHYKLIDQPIRISSDLNVDLLGDSLENVRGGLRLLGTHMTRGAADSLEVFDIPQFLLSSDLDPSGSGLRVVDLQSSLADANLQGRFDFEKALKLTQRLIKEGQLYLANDDSLTQAYYAKKSADSTGFDTLNLNFSVLSQDSINAVFSFLRTPLFLSPGTSVIGNLEFQAFESAKISVKFDSTNYDGIGLGEGTVFFDFIKDGLSPYTLLDIRSRFFDVAAGNSLQLDSLVGDVVLEEGEMRTELFIDQKNLNNLLKIKSVSVFEEDGRITTQFDSAVSWLKIDDFFWRFNSPHNFTFRNQEVEVENFRLYSRGQSLLAEGKVSEQPESNLKLKIKDLGINLLSDLIELRYDLGGKLNIDIELREILGDPKITANGRLMDFSLDDYLYGDLVINSGWDRINQKISLDSRLIHEDESEIQLKGAYLLADKTSPLDFELVTEGMFPLQYISPFVEGQLYEIDGRVGLEDFTITGNFGMPVVLGKGKLQGAEFGVEYFKTKYSFDANLRFEKKSIEIDRFKILDKNKNSADFFGTVYHEGFQDFSFDLVLQRVRNFLVMNTTKSDNPLFYGKIYTLDGVASVSGDLSKLKIDAFLISGPNSSLKIPLDDEAQLERPDYISFVGDDLSESRQLETGLEGFDLNLTVQATDDAEVEMIFDEKVGDIIRGRGQGTINLQINPEGEFTMSGQYEISEGDYLFTAQNIVNKAFKVKPGGTITWSGDPYDAVLDLEAFYAVVANARDLIGGEQNLRVPVNVLMHLEGSLMKPTISLDLEIANLNQQNVFDLARALQSVQYDEQELNKQVFSLMAFRRFAPLGGDLADGLNVSTGVSSISELLSSQFNYWLSQALGDKVTVGLSTTDFTDLNLLVSAKLFNDRVTIERDGTLVSGSSNFSIGNISVNIKLAPSVKQEEEAEAEGRRINSELVLEVFTRESIDQSNQLTNQTGAGVFYKKDFDRIRDLFQNNK
jgi:hypothetical protein